jgi:hypothetical protein
LSTRWAGILTRAKLQLRVGTTASGAQSGLSPNQVSGAILSFESGGTIMAIRPLPIGTGRLEHDLLQVIAIGDDDHEVEFVLLLRATN